MIFKLNVFPWINSYDTLKRQVKKDLKKKEQNFKAVAYGKNQGKRYLIKGENILKIVKKVEKGYTFNHNT